MKISREDLLIILVVLIALFAIREGCNQKNTNNLIKDIAAYSDSAKFEKLKNGALISTNTTLNLQSQAQIKALAASINDTVAKMLKRFKSVNNVTYVTNTFLSGGDTIKNPVKIPCDFKPFKVGHTDSTYTFRGTVGQDFFIVDTVMVPNKIALVHGRKKVGFMRYDYVCDINNSNPLMVTTNIKSYVYKPEKKWYEKTWFHLGAGFAFGVLGNEIIRR